jgi:hypothetical protein
MAGGCSRTGSRSRIGPGRRGAARTTTLVGFAPGVLHSYSRLPGGTFTVQATVSPEAYARIEVEDDGGPWNQGMIDPTRHHGLDIVRAPADEGGIDGDQATRTIWARFDWSE